MVTLKRRGRWSLIACCLMAIVWTSGYSSSPAWAQDGATEEVPAPPGAAAPEAPAPLSSDELNQLVAPIALYPDALVAQVLAGSTYPTEVVEAARWQAANPGLAGASLAAAVDPSWDPSIKALTQFPSVLANMNNNLSWTSALGQAYYYQPDDVLNAVQVMRQRAIAARTLINTPQQEVIDQNGVVMIEPVNPNEVYVPNYNPASIYGAPEAVYPGYSMGEMLGVGLLAFGAGVAVGALASQAWGWHGWNTDWHHHHVLYRNNVFVSNTNTFASVGSYGGGYRGGNFNRPAAGGRPGGFNAAVAGRPQPAQAAGYRAGAPAGRAANEGPRVASRGPGQMGAPAEVRPEAGARPANRPVEQPRPANENPQVASRRPGQMGAPAAARPQAVRSSPRPQASQSNPYRGFAKTPSTGPNKTAFARIAPGSEAVAASARGRSSMGRQSAPARAAAPARQAAARPAAARPAAHAAARPAAPAGHKH
jgi:hypothetical protein